MAPTRAPKITANVTTWTSIIPLPIVLATAVPKPKAATKLKNAAHTTATRGESTRVETTVAMEFAASWKPFRKSNAKATTQMPTANQSMFLDGQELPVAGTPHKRPDCGVEATGSRE